MSYTLPEAIKLLKFPRIKLQNYMKRAGILKVNMTATNSEAHLRCNIARDILFDPELRDNFEIMQV